MRYMNVNIFPLSVLLNTGTLSVAFLLVYVCVHAAKWGINIDFSNPQAEFYGACKYGVEIQCIYQVMQYRTWCNSEHTQNTLTQRAQTVKTLEIERNWTIILQAPSMPIYSQINDEYKNHKSPFSTMLHRQCKMSGVSKLQSCYLLRGKCCCAWAAVCMQNCSEIHCEIWRFAFVSLIVLLEC